MGLFDTGTPSTLEDVLGNQASQAVASSQDAYVQQKKRLAARQAANGQLMGGNKNYARTDLATGEAGNEADIYNNLASALSGVPMEDWTNTRQNQRNLSLAELIGSINKPSTLQEALSGLRTAGSVAATAALF